MSFMVKKIVIIPFLCIGLSTPTLSWAACDDFGLGGVDYTASLGQFFIRLTKEAGEMMDIEGCPDEPECRIESPLLYDYSTKIGRSSAFNEDAVLDADKKRVCQEGDPPGACTGGMVKDKSLKFPSSGFVEGPADTCEVHTEVLSLNMTAFSNDSYVKAGSQAPTQKRSIGEIESKDDGNPNGGFPAESFFNIYADIRFDGLINGNPVNMELYTKIPLTIVNENLDAFPPTVVYIHKNSNAIAVYRKSDDMKIGGLVLAGHGVGLCGFDDIPVPSNKECLTEEEFINVIENLDEMPFPLSVELNSFQAQPKDNGTVAIKWVTLSEENNASFQVWRANPINGKCSDDPNNYINVEAVTPSINSRGTKISGATYHYTDSGLIAGDTYCYALADIEYDSEEPTFHLDKVREVVAR